MFFRFATSKTTTAPRMAFRGLNDEETYEDRDPQTQSLLLFTPLRILGWTVGRGPYHGGCYAYMCIYIYVFTHIHCTCVYNPMCAYLSM